MRKSTTISLSTLLLVFLLTACGSSLQPANLDRATAVAFQDMAYQASQYQLSVLQDPVAVNVAAMRTQGGAPVPRPLTGLLATGGVEPAATAECVVATGTTDDADGDSIPVHAYYSYDCTETASGVTTRIEGSVEVSDKDDADPYAGYTLDMSDLTYSISSGGQTVSLTFDLLADLAVEDATYEATFDLLFTMSAPDGVASISYAFDQTYVANDPLDPFASGTLDFTGNLSLRSDGYIYSLDVLGPDHVVDRACATGFASGTTNYSDNGGNDLAIEFACDSATAYFNGSQVASH